MTAPDDPFDGRHPRDRAIEPEDPMLLTAEAVDGDARLMLDNLIEEFAGLGWDGPHILKLFESRFFMATWDLRRTLGLPYVAARIEAALQRRGVMRFRTQYTGAAGDALDAPDHLDCAPPGPGAEGGTHA